ncbi:BCCT family transporter, partial [Acinetobacter baumannii]|uniref:BCCT family transporter n=1 Tax=Acinetobacter baumannii TaxID=470 RepID=UPI001D17C223
NPELAGELFDSVLAYITRTFGWFYMLSVAFFLVFSLNHSTLRAVYPEGSVRAIRRFRRVHPAHHPLKRRLTAHGRR